MSQCHNVTTMFQGFRESAISMTEIRGNGVKLGFRDSTVYRVN